MPHDDDQDQLPRARRDPYADANEALRKAAEARGAEPVPLEARKPGGPKDPMAAARRALEGAAAAREEATKGKLGLAREADARAQLERMRRGGEIGPDEDTEETDRGDSAPPSPSNPRKRTL